jgi:hypothetical protein
MMTGRAEVQNQDLTFSLGGIPGQTRGFQGAAGTSTQHNIVASGGVILHF